MSMINSKSCYVFFFSRTDWCIGEQSMVLENIKVQVVVERKLTDMEGRQPAEHWKRVTCFMMIWAGYHNAYTMTVASCFVNTVKAVRFNMDSCNRDYEDMTRKNCDGFWVCLQCGWCYAATQHLWTELKANSNSYVNLLETTAGEEFCWKVICVAAGFISLRYLCKKESEVVAEECLWHHQPQFLT